MNRRSLVAAILITLSYQALVVFYYYIDKFTSGIPYLILFTLIPVLFITIIVRIIKGIVRIVKNRKNLTLNYCLPTLIYVLVPFLPLPSAEVLESKVVLRGCHEGTQNQSYVLFRKDHSFEVHATSIVFSNWYTGHWQRRGDTIYLKYNEKDIDYLLGTKVVIDSGRLRPLDSPIKDLNYYRMYYLGYCKHAN